MHIRMFAFGGLVVRARRAEPCHIASSCRPVLGYLLTHRKRTVLRDEVAGALWPDNDSDHARRCLSTVLWRLRKSVGLDESLVEARDEALSVNWKMTSWVDAIALERRIEPLVRKRPGAPTPDALAPAEIARVERGVRLYRGEYLVGIDDDWALIERQRLRNLYLDGLYCLLLAMSARSEWTKALDYGRRLALEEPLREDVHRLLMRAYAASGNRAKALEQYRLCADILAEELDIEPMDETQDLFRSLAGGSRRATQAASPSPAAMKAPRHIARARRLLRLCDGRLQRALALLPSGDDRPKSPSGDGRAKSPSGDGRAKSPSGDGRAKSG